MVVAHFGSVAAIRGNFEGFPASSRWKRYLLRKRILERSLSSFSRYFPISGGTKLANLGGVQVGAVQAQLWRSEIKGISNPSLKSNWFGVVRDCGNHSF